MPTKKIIYTQEDKERLARSDRAVDFIRRNPHLPIGMRYDALFYVVSPPDRTHATRED